VAEALDGEAQPGDALVNFLPVGLPEWIHQDIGKYYFHEWPIQYRIVQTTEGDTAQQDAEFEVNQQFTTGRERVWVASMPADAPPPVARLETALGDSMHQCRPLVDTPQLRIAQFTRAEVCCVYTDMPARIDYGNGITLTGLAPLPDTADDTLPVTLGWRIAPTVPAHTYSVALHVLDAAGELVAQADYGLNPQTFDCRAANIDMAALPPGEYSLHVIVYAWESGARLTGADTATGATGERLLLGNFTRR
jgi:hypothetical protein